MMNIKKAHLTPNMYSRPQTAMNEIKGIVIHWVGNAGTTAKQNRDYFERRKDGKLGYGSAHEIIDLNGDILLCIPDTEIAYHCGSTNYIGGILEKLQTDNPNYCTYGVETCHLDGNGKYTQETYIAIITRIGELCSLYNLDPMKDVYRHYDITGKICPKYFVEYPDEWQRLLKAVKHIQ